MALRSGTLAGVLAAVLLAACGDSSGPPTQNPPNNTPTAIAVVSGNTQTAAVGANLSQQLVVRVTNAQGSGVSGRVVTFRVTGGNGSVTPAVDTTDAQGQAQSNWRLGTSSVQEQRVEAQATGLASVAAFTATAQPGPPNGLERITEVGCAVPGASGARDVVVRVVDSFGNPVAQARVDWTASGAGGSATPTSSTTGADGRATTRWLTGTDAAQSLTATVASLTPQVFTAQVSTSRAVNVGETLTLSGDATRCNDIAAGGARYLVTVTNTATDPNLFASFAVSGGLSGSGSTVAAPTRYDFSRSAAVANQSPEAAQARRAAAMHTRIHDANLRVVREMQSLPAAARIQPQAALVAAPPPNVGDTINLRVPNVTALSCQLTAVKGDIRARVVYVGSRGVVLEDVAAPLAGTMDDLYRQMGQEFDNVMWPLLTANFGSPLAFDAGLDADQRMFMVFSRQVNQMEGVAGFVVSTDFYPTATCPISNRREIFYARVPELSTPGFNGLTRENWFRQTRTVVMHESKHLVAFAHRFNEFAGQPPASAFEHRWLEESSAMVAEELWARSVYGYAQRTNVNYRNSVYCEVRPSGWPECGTSVPPRSMFDHFFLLHDYAADVERLSPLGQVGSDDFTWYGSGWSLLRWAADHSNMSETAFLTALTQETGSLGVANLEARTGRSIADLLTDWTLSLALDDRQGFTAPRPQVTMPSWNLPDIFNGLAVDFPTQCGGPCFQNTPLAQRSVTFGSFNVNIDRVQSGSMAVFELSGPAAGRQLIEFKGASGASLPATLRVTMVRLQ